MNLRVVALLSGVVAAFGIASCGEGGEHANTDGNQLTPVNPNGKDPGSACTTGGDCKSGDCQEGACTTPTGGGDVGTSGSPGTGDGSRGCKDCKTGCGDDGKCASAPSCVREHGGRTCGPDGNSDCCAVAKQGEYTIDKYLITAGRMRAFIEHVKGDVKGFVDKLPANRWNAEWNDEEGLPTDIDSANAALGPLGKKACNQASNTGHTYWTPKTDDDYSDFEQDVLDEKALNCAPWVLLQALCAFDGGHLATVEELKAAFTNGGTTKYPWGDDDLESVNAPDPEERLNIEAAFVTEPAPANMRQPPEVSFLISPPGRYPKGNNKVGIADSAGNVLEFVGDQPRQFIWKADFEHHAANASSWNRGYIWMDARKNVPLGVGSGPWIWGEGQLYGNAGNKGEKGGYYSLGGRCAR